MIKNKFTVYFYKICGTRFLEKLGDFLYYAALPQTDRQTNGRTYGQTVSQAGRQKDRQTDKQTNRQTIEQTDRQEDRQIDRWTKDGQMDRQTV
jgi:hypothetical protein